MDLEEFKRELLAQREETKRLLAEMDALAEARRKTAYESKFSVEEMQAYIARVRAQMEARKSYRELPWWKRLFAKYPEFIA